MGQKCLNCTITPRPRYYIFFRVDATTHASLNTTIQPIWITCRLREVLIGHEIPAGISLKTPGYRCDILAAADGIAFAQLLGQKRTRIPQPPDRPLVPAMGQRGAIGDPPRR